MNMNKSNKIVPHRIPVSKNMRSISRASLGLHTNSNLQARGKIGEGNQMQIICKGSSAAQEILQKHLSRLENAKHCIVFSSGQAANAAILFLNPTGEHIILSEEIQRGTSYIIEFLEQLGVQHSSIDMTNLDAVKKTVKSNTRMVLFETPTNPTLRIIDIREVSKSVRKINPDVIIAVNNTFSTSYFQKPLQMGADITITAFGKYLDGPEDAVLGYICTNNDEVFNRLEQIQTIMGSVSSPNACMNAARSLKMLPLRMERHMINAIKIASYLENNPHTKKVIHPYLESHPQHDIALKQCQGYSGLITVFMSGSEKEIQEFMDNLKMFRQDTETFKISSHICMPANCLDVSDRFKTQKSCRNFLRLSIGVEDADELIHDLDQAFVTVFNKTKNINEG